MTNEPREFDVAIVGAGAAGLMTGICLGRARPGLRIAALDGAAKIGAKILVSGGGRCNVTNVRVTPADFYGGNPNVLRRVFAAFSEQQARAFFEQIGVGLHEEENGKLFPDSNTARSVVAALLAEAERCGVAVRPLHRVTAIIRDEDAFRVAVNIGPSADAESHEFVTRRVVLATGGLSLPKTGSDGVGYAFAQALGHAIVPTTPALDPLVLEGEFHKPLSGIAIDVVLTVRVAGEKPVRIAGPMLWTHFGVSGPAALDASRFWHHAKLDGRTCEITANLVGDPSFEEVDAALVDAGAKEPRKRVAQAVHRWLPARIAEAVCVAVGLRSGQELGHLARPERKRLVRALTEWTLPIAGSRGYKYAEVTAGGVPLREVDPSTMQSRKCPGLFLVGEVLDVDGRIGGFNFQWAWSSAAVAAAGLARAFS